MPDPFSALLISKGIGSVASLLGGLGRGAPQLSEFYEKKLYELSQQQNFTGFLPDKGAYDRSIRAQVDEITSALPVSAEQFEAGLASRGIRGSGEAPKYKYSNVYAPVARAATSAVAKGELGYAKAYQTGSIAAAQLRQQAISELIRYHTARREMASRNYTANLTGQAGFLGDIGEIGSLLALNPYGSGGGGGYGGRGYGGGGGFD